MLTSDFRQYVGLLSSGPRSSALQDTLQILWVRVVFFMSRYLFLLSKDIKTSSLNFCPPSYVLQGISLRLWQSSI